MGNFGPAEMLIIAVFALLVFGPQRLPEIARQVGKAMREFKKISGDFSKELQVGLEDEPKPKPKPKVPAPAKAEPKEPEELKPGPK